MDKIKVRNFGPIKEGFLENGGFLDIKKITAFIGNQGTGKSTVTKLISTFTWLEKALHRGDIKEAEVIRKNKFENTYCDYHRLKNYFRAETEIEFIGQVYSFRYYSGRLQLQKVTPATDYSLPKIMYVPAERNFLSAVDRPERLKGLPSPLYTFLEEYDRSLQELSESLTLPIGNLKIQYQKLNKTANIVGQDYKIRLLEASSGLQSSVPLFVVSRNLALAINKEPESWKKQISIDEEKRLRAEIERILHNNNLSESVKQAALELLSSRYQYSCFINIVEELEQNLFPQSQKDMLYQLLGFANLTSSNELLLTTHSPYIINYLSIAIKGAELLKKIGSSKDRNQALNDLNQIIPAKSCISSDDTIVYELTETGEIKKLEAYQGIPSDQNFLNQFLAETNELFDRLLEIEDTL